MNFLCGWPGAFALALTLLPGFQGERFALRTALERAARCTVRVRDDGLRARLEPLFREAAAGRDGLVLAADDGPANGARVLVALGDEADVVALLGDLGVAPLAAVGEEPAGFRVGERRCTGPGDVLVATLEDPERAGLPLTVHLANSADGLIALGADLTPSATPGLRLWRAGELDFDILPGRTPRELDVAAARAEVLARGAPVTSHGVTVHAQNGIDPNSFGRFLRASVAAEHAVLGLFLAEAEGDRARFRRPRMFLYTDGASFAAATGERDAVAHVAAAGEVVHALLVPAIAPDVGAATARAAAQRLLGPTASPWLARGLGLTVADVFDGRRLATWNGRLAASGLRPRVAELVAPGAVTRHSRLVREPLLGLVVELLLATRGPGFVAELWRSSEAFVPDEAFEEAFASALEERARDFRSRASASVDARRSAVLSGPRRLGVCLEEAGPDGFLDPELGASLVPLVEAGADSVALAVYAFRGAPRERRAGEPGAFATAGKRDLDLAFAVGTAREHGMQAVLDLRLRAEETGTFADGIVLDTEAATRTFFERYQALLVHYALLAEVLEVDVLCVGSELRFAGRTRSASPDAPLVMRELRLASWGEALAVVREIFDGALAFGLSRPAEAAQVAFWDRVDLLGIDLFPAWNEDFEKPPKGVRRRMWRNVLDAAVRAGEEVDRPVFVLQAGVSSSAEGWRRFDVPRGELDLEFQRESLTGLSRSLSWSRDELERVRGLHLWKWLGPSDPSTSSGRGFALQGKPAERVLAELFGRR